MQESTTSAAVVPVAIVEEAWQEVGASFERFCLTAGIATLANMMEEDATRLCGPRYGRAEGKAGHRWGKTKGKVGFHGGKVEIERPRVRARDGGEVPLASWETAMSEDLLGKWALNLMLINVSTRRFGRAVRLPEGDISAAKGTGVSKSAVSRRFVALSAERMAEWMAADLSKLDLLIIQIDGLHIEEDLILLAPPAKAGGDPQDLRPPHPDPALPEPAPWAFSPGLVPWGNSTGRPRRVTVRISSMPSRMLAQTPGASRSRRRARLPISFSAFLASSSSHA